MANFPIDVPLPDKVKKYLTQPHCVDLALPKPGKAELCLPFGGSLKGMVDATKAIPDDCSLTFSLLLQLGPIMAPMECFIKVLKLVKPLMDTLKAVTDPPKLAQVLPDFIKAAEQVIACVAQVQLGVPMFVRDLLLLIAKTIHCIAGQLRTIAGLMGGLSLSIQQAQQNGNGELLAQLQCAQENAANSAASAMQSLEPITALLSMAEPFLGIAGVNPIKIPTAGSADDAQALETLAETLLEISKAMITVAEALPGCG